MSTGQWLYTPRTGYAKIIWKKQQITVWETAAASSHPSSLQHLVSLYVLCAGPLLSPMTVERMLAESDIATHISNKGSLPGAHMHSRLAITCTQFRYTGSLLGLSVPISWEYLWKPNNDSNDLKSKNREKNETSTALHNMIGKFACYYAVSKMVKTLVNCSC